MTEPSSRTRDAVSAYFPRMAYPELLQQLVDARDEANEMAHGVTMALRFYDAAVSSSANSIGAWASARGHEVFSKFSFTFSDALVVSDSVCDGLYGVESACFRVGIHVDGLDEAETLASKTQSKVKGLSRKWRRASQTLQTVLSNPMNLVRLESVLPKSAKEDVAEVVEGLRSLVEAFTEISTLTNTASTCRQSLRSILPRIAPTTSGASAARKKTACCTRCCISPTNPIPR